MTERLVRSGAIAGEARSLGTGALEFAGRAKTVNIHRMNPLSDGRWDDLVDHHPNASAFHCRGWLQALARTYGYEPLVLTTAPPGERLANGLVLCRVSSWLTGARLVSLPFTDHCDLLLDNEGDFQEFVNWLWKECWDQRQQYVELRPLSEVPEACHRFLQYRSYWFHELNLSPNLAGIFRRMHKDSIQRKIQKAEREHLCYESGSSEQLLGEFYELLVMTRRRHRLLPQPQAWFRNLVECLGDKLQIRLARKNGTPIAAILTLRHRSSVIFKYGCSNARFHNLGGMPFLFWRLIEESKASGGKRIDFGRSDLDNEGLMAFKDKLGTTRRLLKYYRYTSSGNGKAAPVLKSKGLGCLIEVLPNAVLSAAGRVLYKHMG